MSSDLNSIIDEHAPSPSAATPTPSTTAKPTTSAPATPAATSTPAPASSEWWKTKYKVDREEKDLDLQETFKDESKRTEFISAYQRGLNADREIKRVRAERDGEILGFLKEQGFDWTPDEKAPGGLKFTARQVAAAKAAVAANADPEAKAEAQGATLAELEKKAREGDPDAIVEWTKRDNERRFKEWQENQQKAKEAEEKSRQEGEYKDRLKRYTDFVYTELGKSFASQEIKDAFADLSEDTLKDIFAAAAQRALAPKGKPQDAIDYVKRRAAELSSVVESRTKRTLETARPASTPPAVHGGSPAGNGKKNTKQDDLDALIAEAVRA